MYCGCFQDEDDFSAHMQRVRTSRPVVIEVKIPKDCVGVVIGRGGSSVKDIQEKTDTRIIFKDECKHFCGCYKNGMVWAGFIWFRMLVSGRLL
jgi:polyribonucleotide nucleotidyltransferase